MYALPAKRLNSGTVISRTEGNEVDDQFTSPRPQAGPGAVCQAQRSAHPPPAPRQNVSPLDTEPGPRRSGPPASCTVFPAPVQRGQGRGSAAEADGGVHVAGCASAVAGVGPAGGRLLRLHSVPLPVPQRPRPRLPTHLADPPWPAPRLPLRPLRSQPQQGQRNSQPVADHIKVTATAR